MKLACYERKTRVPPTPPVVFSARQWFPEEVSFGDAILGIKRGQPNISLDRSGNSGAFIREACVIITVHRARSIRALGCFSEWLIMGAGLKCAENPRCPTG